MPLIIDSGSPAEQLEAFTTAMAQGRSVVITHDQWSDPLRQAAAQDIERARELEQTRFIPRGKTVGFTSGSSGRPRAVIRSADSWRASMDAIAAMLAMTDSDVVWIPGSFTSSLNLYGAWHARERGREVVLGYRAHPAKLGRVTLAYVVPGMLETVLQAHAEGLLPRLRTIATSGTYIVPQITQMARDEGITLVELYGGVELGFVARRTDNGFTPIDGVQVDIRDGELWVRSPYVSEGYLLPDGGGSFRVDGDWSTAADRAEWVDQQTGTFRLLGRGDTVLDTAGRQLVVGDVESRLRRTPGLTEVVVTNLPDAQGGSQLVAVVVEQEPDWSQVAAAVLELPEPERPALWARAAVAPRLPNGGIDRSMIQAALLDQSLTAGPLPG